MANEGFANLPFAVNPPGRVEVDLPFLLEPPTEHLFSEAISAEEVGTFSVNYRIEPIPLRVLDPQTGKQATPIVFVNGRPVDDKSCPSLQQAIEDALSAPAEKKSVSVLRSSS